MGQKQHGNDRWCAFLQMDEMQCTHRRPLPRCWQDEDKQTNHVQTQGLTAENPAYRENFKTSHGLDEKAYEATIRVQADFTLKQ